MLPITKYKNHMRVDYACGRERNALYRITVDYREKRSSYNPIYEVLEIQIYWVSSKLAATHSDTLLPTPTHIMIHLFFLCHVDGNLRSIDTFFINYS